MTNIVENLLKDKNVTYRIQGADFVTLCLNPEHEDTNPSMRIDKIDGKFHCLSCGFKGNIFKYFGILTNHTSIRVAKLKEKLRELKELTKELDYPEGYRPLNKEFRGISIETLKHFEAFTCTGELEDRVVFPMREITGKIAVFVGRHALSAGNPRYMIKPAGASLPLFPSIIPNVKSLVLVEGMFDMINLYDKGLTNVVSINGTNALNSSAAQKLFPYKVSGVEKIFLLMDGDDAGREAATRLQPILEALEFTVEIITVADGTDPGDMSKEDVDMIREYIK
jgi:DNA primase